MNNSVVKAGEAASGSLVIIIIIDTSIRLTDIKLNMEKGNT